MGTRFLSSTHLPQESRLNPISFSRPASLSDAASRLRKNLSYFRTNYSVVLVAVLALSLLSHPLSLLLLLSLLAAWLFLYLFRPSDAPVVILGRAFSDRETLALLVLLTVFLVFLTSVGSLLDLRGFGRDGDCFPSLRAAQPLPLLLLRIATRDRRPVASGFDWEVQIWICRGTGCRLINELGRSMELKLCHVEERMWWSTRVKKTYGSLVGDDERLVEEWRDLVRPSDYDKHSVQPPAGPMTRTYEPSAQPG
ncbi:hypothetical protein Syun_003518 [Stephania yunnanensis]|uniref:PRA1 family protein n=1 Tax=Stephania yunnanensis TaxID=152371 RepID=A0AAP0L1K8_9MAGN